MNSTSAGALRDAVMITAAQKVEHYEMASYGTARTYAQVLGQLFEHTAAFAGHAVGIGARTIKRAAQAIGLGRDQGSRSRR